MELINTFRVSADVESTWRALVDVERVAPCLPGAHLVGPDGDGYRGVVKVKVGPIRMQYEGIAHLDATDEANRIILLRAEGRDSRGQGSADATSRIALAAEDGGTRVSVSTDLQITGKVAQFGRNVLVDVSDRLLKKFADNLEAEISGAGTAASGARVSPAEPAGGATADSGPPSDASPGRIRSGRSARAADQDYLDVLGAVGPVVVPRVLPYLGALVVLLLGWLLVHVRAQKGVPR